MAQEFKADIESIDSIMKRLTVTVPAEDVDREFAKAYSELKKKVNIPGYRRGHVPLGMVKRIYGEDVKTDVARELISHGYQQALEKTGTKPVSDPAIKDFDLSEGQALTFSAELEVRPEIKLPEYTGLPVSREVDEVTDDDVMKVLEDLRKNIAPVGIVTDDRGIITGDIVIMDFEGHVEGKPLPGGKGEGYPLEIGSGSFIPGFEDNLIGLRAGEEKKFVLTFPEDYQQPELAGKEGQFMVTVKMVKERALPGIDDDFARDVGEYANLDELRTKIRNNIAGVREKEARTAMKQQLIEQILNKTDFDLPPSLVEIEKETIQRDYQRRLSIRGLSEEKVRGQIDSAREDISKAAAKNVKVSMILSEIADIEKIKIERGELDKALKDMAGRYQKPVAELRKEMIKSGAMENFYQALLDEKALDLILEKADVSLKESDRKTGGK